MQTIIWQLAQKASLALTQQFSLQDLPLPIQVQRTTKPEFGDFQIASCLSLAKHFSKSPLELANVIANALSSLDIVAAATAVPPGYVNITISDECLSELLAQFQRNPLYIKNAAYENQTIIIDFSSPNIAKPLHVGHIRTSILGDSLQRILKAVGYQVISDNHLGDWGTQFGKLIVAYRKWLHQEAYKENPIKELVRLYQLFVSEEKKQATEVNQGDNNEENRPTELMASARKELLHLQQKDPANYALWEEFVSSSKQEFEKTYKRLGITFDVQLGESFYNDMLPTLVNELLSKNLAIYSQGAVICEIEGESTPLVIRKTDGSYLYGTTDIATTCYRVSTWNPTRMIYVVSSAQSLHLRQVFCIAKRMGINSSMEHVSFGLIRFKDPKTGSFVTGSTREGNVPWLEDILDEAELRARQVVQNKNPNLSLEEAIKIAKVVGIGAVKYNILNRDYVLDINFDIESALSLDGNTAPYIQYAYARIQSILRKVTFSNEPIKVRFTTPKERLLWWKLLDYSFVLQQVSQTSKVHILCDYLYQLATLFNAYYHEVPVLKASHFEQIQRVNLLYAIASNIRHGLTLLGIECLEEM